MTKVKICGITNLDDARLSVSLGANALGFNFYRISPRYVEPEIAREIVGKVPGDVMKVGVFVNESAERIVEIVETVGIDAVQLHGDESPGFVNDIKMITGLKIIKALRVTDGFRPEDALDFDAHAILLDSYSNKHRGGTGETFDWDIAKHVCGLVGELYLAGGLSAENVGSAISEVRPYAVDVCSSVESRPGIKDPNKLKAFINASRNEI